LKPDLAPGLNALARRVLRVGFDRSFSVKLQGYGLLKAACRRPVAGGKRFK
jgi:hypothetical protein